jgi:hypothetical protein
VGPLLFGPYGQTLTACPPDAACVTNGARLDSCLLDTQSRRLHHLALTVRVAAAREWSGIVQTFADPPRAGREPLR